jgi:hypothetical protein
LIGRAVGAMLLLGLAMPLGTALAHARSASYVTWTVSGMDAHVRLRLSLLDMTALEPQVPGLVQRARLGLPDDALREHLQRRVRMLDDAGACAVVAGSYRALSVDAGQVRYAWAVRCGGHGARRVRSDLLMDAVPGHLSFTAVRWAEGEEREAVLDARDRELELPGAPSSRGFFDVATSHVSLGVEHILGGADHLIFLFALLLVARRLSDVALTVTGFTLGHSVTLAAAALGWATPDANAVEALIGLSIALVAVENVWLGGDRADRAVPAVAVAALGAAVALAVIGVGLHAPVMAGIALFAACHFGLLAQAGRPSRWRWVVATLFGLVHGFGFAGALAESLEGSGEHLVAALLGFNVGVEVGQLLAVLVAWPLLRWLGAAPARRGWTLHAGSAAALAAGMFWFVTRAYG